MIAKNTVKVNGKWFYAGQEIEEVVKSTSDFSQYMNQPEEYKTYTKTEISRMSIVDLKAFAKKQGVENAEDMTGSELKQVLIDKLKL